MKEDQDLSTQVRERSSTRDKLELRLQKKMNRARINTSGLKRTTKSEKMKQTGTWVRQVARAMEEQLRDGPTGAEDAGTSRGKQKICKYDIAGLFTKATRTKE